jgi:transposase
MGTLRQPYPSDVTDDEGAFVAPSLTLVTVAAPQRRHDLREVFDALRWLVRSGSQWRSLPHDFPPWAAVSPQAQRGLAAGRFAAMAADPRVMPRVADGRNPQPTAIILDGRTLQATPESGQRAGFDGHETRTGAKPHAAVDPLGHLLAARVAPANRQERAPVEAPAQEVQEVTGQTGDVAFGDQGDTGEDPAEAAAAHGIEPVVGSLPEATRGFVLLPRRWVAERPFAWATRFRRLAKDDERLPETVVGLHVVAFACPMLHRATPLLGASP